LLDLKDLREAMVLPDRKDQLDHKAQLGLQVPKGPLESTEQLDLPDRKDCQVQLERKDLKGLPVLKAYKVQLVPLAHRALKDCKEWPGRLVRKVRKGLQEYRGCKDLRARWGLPDRKGHKALQEQLDRKVSLDLRVL